MTIKNGIFESFSEYWHLTGCLNKEQRQIIFSSLPEEQRKKIQRSYRQGKWEDLFMRNQIDKMLDELKKDYNIDVLQMRTKVFSGKSYFMKKSQWEFLKDVFRDYDTKHKQYALGGLTAEDIDGESVLILANHSS